MEKQINAGNLPGQLAEQLAEVTLASAKTSAAVGEQSVSGWLEDVRAGRAPQPVIRTHRYTRWRLADVRDYWAKRIESAAAETSTSTTERAKKASEAARAKRSTRVQ